MSGVESDGWTCVLGRVMVRVSDTSGPVRADDGLVTVPGVEDGNTGASGDGVRCRRPIRHRPRLSEEGAQVDPNAKMVTPRLTGVPETALWTLYMRALATCRPESSLRDPKAVDVVAALDYPFAQRWGRQDERDEAEGEAIRTLAFDREVREFLDHRPDGVVVALAEGLQTQFWRADNGRARWVGVDLPEMVASPTSSSGRESSTSTRPRPCRRPPGPGSPARAAAASPPASTRTATIRRASYGANPATCRLSPTNAPTRSRSRVRAGSATPEAIAASETDSAAGVGSTRICPLGNK